MLKKLFKSDKMMWVGFLYAILIASIILYLERGNCMRSTYLKRYEHDSMLDILKRNFIKNGIEDKKNKENHKTKFKEGLKVKKGKGVEPKNNFDIVNILKNLDNSKYYRLTITFKYYTPKNHIQESIDVINHIIHNVNSNRETPNGLFRDPNQIPDVFDEGGNILSGEIVDGCDETCFFTNQHEWGQYGMPAENNARISLYFARDRRFPKDNVFVTLYNIEPSKKHFNKEHEIDKNVYRETFKQIMQKVLMPGKTDTQIDGKYLKLYGVFPENKIKHLIIKNNKLHFAKTTNKLEGSWRKTYTKDNAPSARFTPVTITEFINIDHSIFNNGKLVNGQIIYDGDNDHKNYTMYVNAHTLSFGK